MNIFLTDKDPQKAAEYLDDKRVVKMVLETAQILCTAHHFLLGEYPDIFTQQWPYKPTHVNHPVVLWVRRSEQNLLWTYYYMMAISGEYERRFRKRRSHKSWEVVRDRIISCEVWRGRESIDFNPRPMTFQNSAKNSLLGIDYSHMEDVEEAYRLYLKDRWRTDKRTPTWYGEEMPFRYMKHIPKKKAQKRSLIL